MYALAYDHYETMLPYEELRPSMPRLKGEEFHLAIPSQTNAIDTTVLMFQRRISRFCRAYQIPPINITLCLREALANAIIHGNLEISSHLKETSWENFEALVRERETRDEFARRKVMVRCRMNARQIAFEIEDEGPGFDSSEAQHFSQVCHLQGSDHDPLEIAASGRGLLIIAGLMDEVFWNERGNRITMIKNLK